VSSVCTVCLVKTPTRQHRSTGPLADRLATLADPRCRRGKRHPFVAVVLIACSAVTCGARSFVAIDEWAAGAPQDVLARLGARTATALSVRIPPSGATIRRVIKDTCPGGLADLLGHDPSGTDTLALDGKSARGSRLGATPAAHLLAAMTGTGMTVTQLRVPEKTKGAQKNNMRIPVLGPIVVVGLNDQERCGVSCRCRAWRPWPRSDRSCSSASHISHAGVLEPDISVLFFCAP
jgi:DDE family transposase